MNFLRAHEQITTDSRTTRICSGIAGVTTKGAKQEVSNTRLIKTIDPVLEWFIDGPLFLERKCIMYHA